MTSIIVAVTLFLAMLATRIRTTGAFANGRNVISALHHNGGKERRQGIVRFACVTGNACRGDDNKVQVTLFTKEGCTLCDKVKDILSDCREEIPHNLDLVDITDNEHANWHSKYKYDIPVLHVNGKYWLKHRTTLEEAKEGLLEAAQKGSDFQTRPGEPNAEAMERK